MNKFIGMGRLTRDPEVRYSQGEKSTAIASFSIAVNRKFKRENEADVDFFNCTAFGKQAEFVEKYLKQGTKVLITGRVQNNNYTNKEGQKVYSVQIMVEEIEFTESKAASTGTTPSFNPNGVTDANGFMNIPESLAEELPFA